MKAILPHAVPVLCRSEHFHKCRPLAQPRLAVPQDWKTYEIDCTWPAAEGPAGLERALHRICGDADAAIAVGARFTLLTDRAAGACQ